MTDDHQQTILSVLGDKHARNILQATMSEPMSADQLSEVCDISTQSVYRRTDALTASGLLETELQHDADGHHYKTFSADPTQIVVEITEEDVDTTVTRTEPMADRLAEFVNQVSKS
jgi:predicted transcriptional regulator